MNHFTIFNFIPLSASGLLSPPISYLELTRSRIKRFGRYDWLQYSIRRFFSHLKGATHASLCEPCHFTPDICIYPPGRYFGRTSGQNCGNIPARSKYYIGRSFGTPMGNELDKK